ncbi:MAG TPA: HPF/RaiA family ribosome-associated protein [Prosthecobacter sp.]|nr:HPF/RaiA family ribosome-associated protein [Prosthecobacter sp.]
MEILVNTDNNITGDESLTQTVEGFVNDAVEHFQDHITRVEVHLNDVNSKKGGATDKRCMMEARVKAHPPVAVTHEAESLMFAMDGAAEKLRAALDTLLGRLHRHP